MVHPRAPPFISHLFLCHFCLFPPIRPHSPLGWGLYTCALLFFICARAPFHSSYISFLLLSNSSYASTLPSVRGYTPARCYFSSARARPLSCLMYFSLTSVYFPIKLSPEWRPNGARWTASDSILNLCGNEKSNKFAGAILGPFFGPKKWRVN